MNDFTEKGAYGCLAIILFAVLAFVVSIAVGVFFGVGFGFLAYAVFVAFTALNHVPMVAIENPIGIMSNVYRKPDQIIHPYMFGDPARKATCLWLKGLPALEPTNVVEPEVIEYKNGKGTDSPWHMGTLGLPPALRSRERSKTFPGIADAMAAQWGAFALESE